MVRIVDQNIPADLLERYKASLRQSTDWKPGANIYTARKRQPFRLPHMQSDSGNSPSGEQVEVREAFKKCVNCYNKSPQTGGATPPDIGYRSREWWHTAAAGSGLWYYDYFIQQTWQTFFDGGTPDWCIKEVKTLSRDGNEVCWVNETGHTGPLYNNGYIYWTSNKRRTYRSYLRINISSLAGKQIAFFRIHYPIEWGQRFHKQVGYAISYEPWYGIQFNLCDPFTPWGISWANQPTLGKEILLYPWGGGAGEYVYNLLDFPLPLEDIQAAADNSDTYFYMSIRYKNDWAQIHDDNFCGALDRIHGMYQSGSCIIQAAIK